MQIRVAKLVNATSGKPFVVELYNEFDEYRFGITLEYFDVRQLAEERAAEIAQQFNGVVGNSRDYNDNQ